MYKCPVALQLILIKLICEEFSHNLSERVVFKVSVVVEKCHLVGQQSAKLSKYNMKIFI